MDAKGRSRLKRFATVGVICLVAIAAVALVELYEFERRFEGEMNAMGLVCDVVERYVQSNGYTRWPRSWEELERVEPQFPQGHGFVWPRDVRRVKEWVWVDWSLDLNRLAREDPEAFRAISTMDPNEEVRSKTAVPLARRMKLAMEGKSG